jgi:hypothetical protein
MQTVENIMRTHKIREVIADCQFELATNFDSPAIRIISYHASRLALTYEQFARLPEEFTVCSIPSTVEPTGQVG